MPGPIRIGVSGWRYAPWRGHFYPPGLPQARELAFAASRFGSLELNGSFYSLQRPSSYARWAADTPPGFVFAVKGPRYVTHMLKLRNAGTALANFFASGLFALGPKLGPILWQFPPQLAWNPPLFEDFLASLPRSTVAAARLAASRDARMDGRDLLTPDADRPLRHAVEVRHPSFVDPAFMAQLRRHGIAWVVADTPRPWPLFDDVTADFVYLRLHGATELYQSRYTDAQLDAWAARIAAWADGRQPSDARLADPAHRLPRRRRAVYCYFDNTDKRHAPDNAIALAARLGSNVTPTHIA